VVRTCDLLRVTQEVDAKSREVLTRILPEPKGTQADCGRFGCGRFKETSTGQTWCWVTAIEIAAEIRAKVGSRPPRGLWLILTSTLCAQSKRNSRRVKTLVVYESSSSSEQ